MIQPGNYRARATGYQFGFAETGTEQVAVTFEIVEEGEHRGQSITWFGFFTPSSSERTVEALRTCGWQGDDLSDLAGIDRNEVALVIEHEEYNGKIVVRVRWINRVGTGRVDLKRKMTDAQRIVLAKRLKGLVLATKPHDLGGATPATKKNGYPSDWDGQGL